MSETSGRQRLLAMALGIGGVDRMTREELSAAIDRHKANRQSPPNDEQLRLATRWGIDLTNARSAGAATNRLWDAALARVFVLSVVRKISNAEWRFHADCPIAEPWLNGVATELGRDADRAETVREIDNAMSGTVGDAWFRFGKRQAESTAYKFVEVAARRDLNIEQLAKSPKNPREQKDQTGCLTVLVPLFLFLVWLAATSA